jgi:hypothetical protein
MTPTEAGMVVAHCMMLKTRATQDTVRFGVFEGQYLSPIKQLFKLVQKYLPDTVPNRFGSIDSHKFKSGISLKRVFLSQTNVMNQQQQQPPAGTETTQFAPTTTTTLPEYSLIPSIHLCALFIAILLFLVLLLLYTRSIQYQSSENTESWHNVSGPAPTLGLCQKCASHI